MGKFDLLKITQPDPKRQTYKRNMEFYCYLCKVHYQIKKGQRIGVSEHDSHEVKRIRDL